MLVEIKNTERKITECADLFHRWWHPGPWQGEMTVTEAAFQLIQGQIRVGIPTEKAAEAQWEATLNQLALVALAMARNGWEAFLKKGEERIQTTDKPVTYTQVRNLLENFVGDGRIVIDGNWERLLKEAGERFNAGEKLQLQTKPVNWSELAKAARMETAEKNVRRRPSHLPKYYLAYGGDVENDGVVKNLGAVVDWGIINEMRIGKQVKTMGVNREKNVRRNQENAGTIWREMGEFTDFTTIEELENFGRVSTRDRWGSEEMRCERTCLQLAVVAFVQGWKPAGEMLEVYEKYIHFIPSGVDKKQIMDLLEVCAKHSELVAIQNLRRESREAVEIIFAGLNEKRGW